MAIQVANTWWMASPLSDLPRGDSAAARGVAARRAVAICPMEQWARRSRPGLITHRLHDPATMAWPVAEEPPVQTQRAGLRVHARLRPTIRRRPSTPGGRLWTPPIEPASADLRRALHGDAADARSRPRRQRANTTRRGSGARANEPSRPRHVQDRVDDAALPRLLLLRLATQLDDPVTRLALDLDVVRVRRALVAEFDVAAARYLLGRSLIHARLCIADHVGTEPGLGPMSASVARTQLAAQPSAGDVGERAAAFA